MNHLFIALYVGLMSVAGGAVRGTRARVSNTRGANFIEYALLAVIAVGIGFIFRTQLSGAFDSILESVTGGIESGGRR